MLSRVFLPLALLTISLATTRLQAQNLLQAVSDLAAKHDEPTKIATVHQVGCNIFGKNCVPADQGKPVSPGSPVASPPDSTPSTPAPASYEPVQSPTSLTEPPPNLTPSLAPGPGMVIQSGTPFVLPGLLAFRSQLAATANLASMFDLFANLLPPTFVGTGRKLQQSASDYPPVASSIDPTGSAIVSTYQVPVSLFSLNANRAGSSAGSSWLLGPNLEDLRLLPIYNRLSGKCPPIDTATQTSIQTVINTALATDDAATSFPTASQNLLDSISTKESGCTAGNQSPNFADQSGLVTNPSSYPPDTFNASAYNDIHNPGLGLDTAALTVTGVLGERLDYAFGGNITVTNVSSISDCPKAATPIGYGTVQVCVTLQMRSARLTPAPAPLSGRRLLQSSGNNDECPVEVRFKCFIPTQVVYAPTPLNFIPDEPYTGPAIFHRQTGAFNGNNRDFSYSSTDSKADIIGSFVVRGGDLSDLNRISPASPSGVFGPTVRYRYNETTPLSDPSWGGTLNSPNPTILPGQMDQLPRDFQNLFMNGIDASPSGTLQAEVHAGNPLVTLAPKIDGQFTLGFQSVEGPSNTYSYQFNLQGAHDGFPAYELYINSVLVYSYSPVGSALGPYGLFLNTQYPTLDFAPIPGCPKPITCNAGLQTPLEYSGGQSPITDTRIIPATGASNFTLNYNAFSVPDRFFLFNADTNAILFDTGFVGDPGLCDNIPDLAVSGPGAGFYVLPVTQELLNLGIGVDSPCDGTFWEYDVVCG